MNKLVELRKKSGLVRRELAEKLGVSKAAIAMWETGKRKPNVIMLKKLAKVLGCTTDQLLEDIDI